MPYNAPAQNPNDPNVVDYTPETLPLAEIIRRAVQAGSANLRVCLPAQITEVHGNQQVDLQPLLKGRLIDNTVFDLPIIKNALVSMPMGQDYGVRLPLAVGDTGVAIFCDRSLDVWALSDGGSVDPQDTRCHFLGDAIFVPGLVPIKKQTQDTTGDLTVTNGSAVLKVQKAGTFMLKNDNQELFDLLNQLTQNLIDLMNTLATNTFTLTLAGPQPFIASTISALNQLKTTAQGIQDNLATLKGS